jgi:hypothetical protein
MGLCRIFRNSMFEKCYSCIKRSKAFSKNDYISPHPTPIQKLIEIREIVLYWTRRMTVLYWTRRVTLSSTVAVSVAGANFMGLLWRSYVASLSIVLVSMVLAQEIVKSVFVRFETFWRQWALDCCLIGYTSVAVPTFQLTCFFRILEIDVLVLLPCRRRKYYPM